MSEGSVTVTVGGRSVETTLANLERAAGLVSERIAGLRTIYERVALKLAEHSKLLPHVSESVAIRKFGPLAEQIVMMVRYDLSYRQPTNVVTVPQSSLTLLKAERGILRQALRDIQDSVEQFGAEYSAQSISDILTRVKPLLAESAAAPSTTNT